MVYYSWKLKPRTNNCHVEYSDFNKGKVQPIDDVDIPYRSSNKLRGNEIMLSDMYVCDDSHDEIMETVFSRE